jgi:ribulose kinase
VTGGTDRSRQYVVGVDYGTLPGRAVVVRVSDGTELGSAVFAYPHHDYFGRAGKGGHQGGGNDVMHRLRRIRREALP